MDSSFNKDAIKEYSKAYSSKVVQLFFQNKDQISGEEIIKLTSVKQVNLFVLKLIFEKWNEEMELIKSPYFDYENEAVQEVFVRFKNVLSKNILISKEYLEPLLVEAIYDSILLIVSPYHYYDEELRKHGELVEVDKLKIAKKFIKVNVAILNAIIEKLQKEDSQLADPIKTLDAVLEETDLIPDDITGHIDNLNSVLRLDFEKIYEEESSESNEEPIDQPEELIIEQDTQPEEIEETTISETEVKEEEPEPINEIVESAVEEVEEEQPEQENEQDDLNKGENFNEIELNEAQESVEEEPEPDNNEDQDGVEEQLEPDNIENTLEEMEDEIAPEDNPLLTLNDTFSTEEVETLADLHHKQSVEQIETSITLNQRFMFVNGLFDGDVETFNATIKTLDEMDNYEVAVTHMAENFDHWDSEDEDVIEFFDIVKRRFL